MCLPSRATMVVPERVCRTTPESYPKPGAGTTIIPPGATVGVLGMNLPSSWSNPGGKEHAPKGAFYRARHPRTRVIRGVDVEGGAAVFASAVSIVADAEQ